MTICKWKRTERSDIVQSGAQTMAHIMIVFAETMVGKSLEECAKLGLREMAQRRFLSCNDWHIICDINPSIIQVGSCRRVHVSHASAVVAPPCTAMRVEDITKLRCSAVVSVVILTRLLMARQKNTSQSHPR